MVLLRYVRHAIRIGCGSVVQLAKKSHDFAINQDPILADVVERSNGAVITYNDVKMRLHGISSYIDSNTNPLMTNNDQLLGVLVTNGVPLPVVSKKVGLEFEHPVLGKIKFIELLPKTQIGEIYGYKGIVQVISSG